MLPGFVFVFLLSFLLACIFISQVISISHKKHLFDEPLEKRKIHLVKTPNLGGVAVVAALFLAVSFFLSAPVIPHLNYIIFSALLLFLTGLADDLVGVAALKKMLLQVVVALLLVLLANCRFMSFGGFMGIDTLPVVPSVVLSVTFVVALINAFNLIDGINYLAAGIGIVSSILFAFYFYSMQSFTLLCIAVSLMGCLAGFLIFNRTPARIFLGDSGSTFLGLVMAIFSIFMVNDIKDNEMVSGTAKLNGSVIALMMTIIVIPVFDTIRIFSLRIARGKNPFEADRQHIHHRLLDAGFTHLQATGILLFVNMILVCAVLCLQQVRGEIVILLLAVSLVVLDHWLTIHNRKIIRNIAGNIPGVDRIKARTRAGNIKFIIKDRAMLKQPHAVLPHRKD